MEPPPTTGAIAVKNARTDEPLVTIASFPTSFEASLAKGALNACGIFAVVPDEILGALSRNRGGIPVGVLQVFASDRDRAIAELRRSDMKIVARND
jgi:hypothetical protein